MSGNAILALLSSHYIYCTPIVQAFFCHLDIELVCIHVCVCARAGGGVS